MSAPSSMRSLRTFWPSGPVWWVFSIMPRILPAHSRTSPSDFATFTPPPLPRPPAWICALTTHTLPPSSRAALTASSTEKQGMPRGVATPYFRSISFAWYSWIFMFVLECRVRGLSRRTQPVRIDAGQAYSKVRCRIARSCHETPSPAPVHGRVVSLGAAERALRRGNVRSTACRPPQADARLSRHLPHPGALQDLPSELRPGAVLPRGRAPPRREQRRSACCPTGLRLGGGKPDAEPGNRSDAARADAVRRRGLHARHAPARPAALARAARGLSMRYVLALDQGTTSSRAIVFDESGRPRASAQKEFRQFFPQPGWVEHDPEEIWRSQIACARSGLKKAKLKPNQIAAIGTPNQRETTLAWDRRTGQAVHRAIVWQDRRTAGRCEVLKKEGYASVVAEKTGLVIDPYFSATKLSWLLEAIPGLRARAERGDIAFGTVDTWLAWKLSGGALHLTDPSNASRTMLYDIHRGEWDDELLRVFRVPRAMLPEVRASSQVYGASSKALLGAEVPVAGIAGDQQAALFGQACHEPGMAKNTYGTGCFLLLNTGAKAIASRNGLFTTSAAQAGEKQFALEGSVFIGGAVVQWLRDGLKLIKKSGDVEKLARSVSDSGGVYLVPAFTGLGAPHWDPYARGTVVGLTRGSNAGHLARAALESIAFQSAELLHAMEQDSGQPSKELRVDGGAAANDLLMQFQADLLGVPVVRPKVLETTALGAAYLAGLATGVWATREEIAKQWKVAKRFEPKMQRDEAARRMEDWKRALERAKNWQRT